MEEKKEIEIINGDGSNLNISGVTEHLNITSPKSHETTPKNIIVPKEVKNLSDDEDDEENKNNEKNEENNVDNNTEKSNKNENNNSNENNNK